jgi:hypothetical protein
VRTVKEDLAKAWLVVACYCGVSPVLGFILGSFEVHVSLTLGACLCLCPALVTLYFDWFTSRSRTGHRALCRVAASIGTLISGSLLLRDVVIVSLITPVRPDPILNGVMVSLVGYVIAMFADHWATRRMERWRRVISPGRCPVCCYDLTGNVSGRCPECGTDVSDLEGGTAEPRPEERR